ncbi:MAG: GlcG/HbpS family heme-binding protein [Ectopseudomonas guguanensis]|uniref:GlcG/HbpS family heme-binding protein n=1 Tax=Ectopseudomonas guguanensis TaxID=1198456 RepID=UPI003918891C
MSAELRHTTSITLALAMRALQATLDEAQRASVRVSIAITDAAGQPIHTAHMDGAPAPCRAIAANKALTAAGFGLSTGAWAERLQHSSDMVRQGLPLQSGLVLFGGGEPFLLDGAVVGAVGVSGASEAQDAACAAAAVRCVADAMAARMEQPVP